MITLQVFGPAANDPAMWMLLESKPKHKTDTASVTKDTNTTSKTRHKQHTVHENTTLRSETAELGIIMLYVFGAAVIAVLIFKRQIKSWL